MSDDEPMADAVTQRFLAAASDDVSPRRTELRRLADAARLMIERLVATDAPDHVIAAVTADLQAAAARLEGYSRRSLYGFAELANAGGEPGAMFDHSPFIGTANPLAPPMSLEMVDRRVLGRVVFGSAYEGPPGCVHGGYIAGVFDELLGATQSLSGSPGMTGTLSIRYQQPTPLHTELRLEATLDRVEGRKIFTKGAMFAGDVLTATGEGLFISIAPDRFADLKAEREARERSGKTS